MRWNQLKDDIPRACALADLMLAAALSDNDYAQDEFVVVAGTLMKVLGVSELPTEIYEHMGTYDPDKFVLADAVARLQLDGEKDAEQLVKAVARVIRADNVIVQTESEYLSGLAQHVGVSAEAVAALLDG